jgi:hypothetical protein
MTPPEAGRDWRDDDRVMDVLEDGELLHVAVATRRGPHVTPIAFDLDGGRLWFLTPRQSVKTRAIARRRTVGGLVQLGARAVMLRGRARIVDPLTARGLYSGRRLFDLPFAATGYLARNHRHATGILQERPAPTLPLARVAVEVKLIGVALLEEERLVATFGHWERRELLLHGAPPRAQTPSLAGIPAGLRSLLTGPDRPAVLGWPSVSGPMAVPASWNSELGVAQTNIDAMTLAGAYGAGPACLVSDRWGYRLEKKQGILLRGPGHARVDGQTATATIEAERVTYWLGETSSTVTGVSLPR